MSGRAPAAPAPEICPSADIKKGEIYSIQFGIYTHAEKQRLAVVEVTSSTINYPSGMPRDDGPNSLLLGVDSHRTFCKTCNNTAEHCQGHAGIINFPDKYPVYNPLHLVNNDTVKMLRVVCFWCSAPLVSKASKPATTSKRAFAQVIALPHVRRCPACGFGPTTDAYCPECALDRKLESTTMRRTQRALKRAAATLTTGLAKLDKKLQREARKAKTKTNKAARKHSKQQAAVLQSVGARKRKMIWESQWIAGTVAKIQQWANLVTGRIEKVSGRVQRQKTLITCPNPECGAQCQPTYKRAGCDIVANWDDARFPSAEVEAVARKPFTPYKCWQILRGIPESWRRDTLHFPAPIPDAFVWRSILVPPVFIRPSISVRGTNAEEDVTRSVADVAKHSQDIKKNLHALEHGKPTKAASKGAKASKKAKGKRKAAKKKSAKNGGAKNGGAMDGAAGSAATAMARPTTEEECRAIMASINQSHAALQKAVNIMVDRDIRSSKAQPIKQSVAHMKPRRTLMNRLTGKTGRLRGQLLAKRVGCCARAVAAPHATCDIDEFGIPKRLAMKIPVMEVITDRNCDDLLACVRRGAGQIGGALYVEHVDGSVTNLVNVRDQDTSLIVAKCKRGDTVARMLRNGDPVIGNRQPTLHLLGFMAGRAFLHDDATMKTRTETEQPYNGDYDGDEKNMHKAQGLEARAEMEHIMSIRNNTIDTASASPVFVPVQGTMVGFFILSDADLKIPFDVAADMYMQCRYPKKDFHDAIANAEGCAADVDICASGVFCSESGERQVFARAMLDVLLPPDFCFCKKGVRIRRGRFAADTAQVTKKHLGGPGSMLHLLALKYGEPSNVEFVSDLGRMVRIFMRDFWGFTVSYEDILIEPHIAHQIDRDIDDIVAEANEFDLERDQLRVLSQASAAVTDGLQRSDVYRRSKLRIMIESGSKGKPVNFEQIAGCVGQQIIGSARPECDESGRALSCFKPGDTSVQCFGWVGRSYLQGMTPAQNSFHARGSREGVTEVACGTAKTGYLQRRFQKLMEAIKLVYDMLGLSVRDSRNAVVMLFFINGFFTKFVEPVQLDCVRDPMAAFTDVAERECPEDVPPLRERFPIIHRFYMRLDKLRIQLLQSRTLCAQTTGNVDFQFMLPLNVDRWMAGVADNPVDADKYPSHDPTTGEPYLEHDALVKVLDLLEELPPQFHVLAALKYHVGRTLIDAFLEGCGNGNDSGPSSSCFALSAPVLHALHDELERCIAKAAAEAGTSLGALAASAAMKNMTQTVLNSFHSAGAGSAETKTGVDRCKEIVEISLTGVGQVRVKAREAAINRNRGALLAAAKALEPVRLCDIVAETRIRRPRRTALVEMLRKRSCPLLYRTALPQNAWAVVYTLNVRVLAESKLTLQEAVRSIFSTVSLPFRFSPWTTRAARTAQKHRRPTLTFFFSADTFIESEVHAQSIALLDVLLKGYRQIQHTNVFRDPFNESEFEIRATVKPLRPKAQASALEPFFNNSEFFDVEHMICTSVPVVHSVYGIEAAMLTIFSELYGTARNSGFVHAHHIYLLAVVICVTGRPLAVTRHGMKAKGCDVLQQASFEQPRAVFASASLHGDASVNIKNCLSSSTIVGGIAGIGTGTVDVKLDPAYKALWDAEKEAAATRPIEAIAAGRAQDADAHQARRDLQHELEYVPTALRPTQFWDMEEDVPRLLHEFRRFAADWMATHPQIVQRFARSRLRSDLHRQQAHARRQKKLQDEIDSGKGNNSKSKPVRSPARKRPKQKAKEEKKKEKKKKKRHRKKKKKKFEPDSDDPPLFAGNVEYERIGFMQEEFAVPQFDVV